jgi:O-antigen ligase
MNKFTVFFQHASSTMAVLFAFSLPLGLAPENTSFILLTLCCLLAGNWKKNWEVFKTNAANQFLILLCAIYLIGTLYSHANLHWTLKLIQKYSALIAIFLFMPLFTDNPKLKRQCYIAFIISCTLTAILGFLWELNLLPNWHIFHSQSGPYVLSFSIFTSMFIAVAAWWCLFFLPSTSKKWQKCLLILGFLLMSYSLFFQNIERTGMLLYFVCALFYAYFLFLDKLSLRPWASALLSLFSITIFAMILSALSHHLDGRTIEMLKNFSSYAHYHNTSSSMGVRIHGITTSISLFLTSPIWGHGTGSFLPLTLSIYHAPTSSPQNTFAFILAEQGLIGIIIFLLLLFSLYRIATLKTEKSATSIALTVLAFIIIGGISQSVIVSENTRYFIIFFSAIAFSGYYPLNSIFNRKKY